MRSGCLVGLALSLLVASPLATPAGAAPGRVEQVTLTGDAHGPVILVRTSRPLRYRSRLISSPPRLILDFDEARFAWRDGPLRPEAGPVAEIRGSQFRPGIARVVIALRRAVPHRIASTPEGLRIAFPPPGAVAPGPGEAAAPRPILHGIVLRDEDAVAYMEDPRTRRVRGFKLGDRVGDGIVDAIDEHHVTIRMPAGSVELRVGDPAPARR